MVPISQKESCHGDAWLSYDTVVEWAFVETVIYVYRCPKFDQHSRGFDVSLSRCKVQRITTKIIDAVGQCSSVQQLLGCFSVTKENGQVQSSGS